MPLRLLLCLLLCLPIVGYAQGDGQLDSIRSLLGKADYGAALDSCQSALRQIEGNTRQRRKQATLQYYAGVSLKGLGRYAKADEMYGKALEQAKYNEDTLSVCLYSYSYANLLMLSGSYRKAIGLLEAMPAGTRYDGQRLLTLSSLYYMRDEEGDREKALAYVNEYLSTHSPGEADYAVALQDRGFILWGGGELEEARRDISEALSLEHPPTRYVVLGNLAMVEADLGDFPSALRHIDEALQGQGGTPQHPDYLVSLRKKALILLKAGEREQALSLYRTYFEAERRQLEEAFAKTKDNEFRLNYWYSQKPHVSEVFQLEDTAPAFLYDVALYRRQMALLPTGCADIAKETGASLAELRKALKPNEAAIEFVCYYDDTAKDTIYAALVASPKASPKYVYLLTKKELHGYLLSDGTELEEAVCSSSAGLKNLIYTDSTLARKVWKPLLEALPSSCSTIYFAPDGILQMLAIESLPYAPLKGKDARRLTSTANLISRSSAVKRGRKRVLVIGGVDYDAADGEALAEGEETNHLAYDYMKDEFGLDVSKGAFSYLQGSKAEADSILSKLPDAEGSEEGHSSEYYLKRSLGQYDIVHLSTHGYSLKVNVGRNSLMQGDSLMADKTLLASGIALRGANVAGKAGEKEDGLLSARELCDLDSLEGVELVVLSACQTAQGVVSDEGPAGVVRGLKKAGVKTIMATLWPVDDTATSLFMNAFYDALQTKGATKHEAFLKAQEAVRSFTVSRPAMRFSPRTLSHQPDRGAALTLSQPYASPYYWAPFIMIDDL
ncbi:MAG: CHAT domain-containing tetratricopeptide repeat protein [Prevotellaceae bacterium]|nr:CHAT domain-containing tetratricopeptide repeat protein [Prevotellaceae bacterium]